LLKENKMTPLFKKLNFKEQPAIVILNAPSSFESELFQMKGLTKPVKSLKGLKTIEFAMIFATKQKEVDEWSGKIIPLLDDDAVFWICYPKGSSKKYTCDFNRDTGWITLGKLGFEPVRGIAIDEDWSALRFRKPEHIKTMTRKSALTTEGKKRIAS
jgi:hypothetical protein